MIMLDWGIVLRFFVVFILTFVAMEFFSYLVHRFVYHKLAWFVHKSHHTPRNGPFEANDTFPVLFAAITIVLVVTALEEPVNYDLLAGAAGSTAYGLVYFFVHDLYVHRRVKSFTARIPLLRKVKQAHAVHHRYGGEPYGLLFFADPKKLAAEQVDETEPV